MNTTIPAVQNKLLELFKAAVGTETEVWRKRPNEDHQLAENVYLGEVRGRREWRLIAAGIGPNARQEDYTVAVEVEVYREGTDLEGTEARMWELALAVEGSVATRPTLDGLSGLSWTLSEEFQQATEATPDGVLAKYVFGVAIVARI